MLATTSDILDVDKTPVIETVEGVKALPTNKGALIDTGLLKLVVNKIGSYTIFVKLVVLFFTAVV